MHLVAARYKHKEILLSGLIRIIFDDLKHDVYFV